MKCIDLASLEYLPIDSSKAVRTTIQNKLLNLLSSPLFCKFAEIDEDQLAKISEVNREITQAAKSQLPNSTIAESKTIIGSLAEKQDLKVRKILLPHQVELAENYHVYAQILMEGPATSLVQGSLAGELGLSKAEREKIRLAGIKIHEEYEKAVEKARERAFQQLVQTVPKKHRELVADRLEPLKHVDGSALNLNSEGLFKVPDEPTRVIFLNELKPPKKQIKKRK